MATNMCFEEHYQNWLKAQADRKQEAVNRECERRAQLLGTPGAVIHVGSWNVGYTGNGSSGDAKPAPNKKVLLLCQS